MFSEISGCSCCVWDVISKWVVNQLCVVCVKLFFSGGSEHHSQCFVEQFDHTLDLATFLVVPEFCSNEANAYFVLSCSLLESFWRSHHPQNYTCEAHMFIITNEVVFGLFIVCLVMSFCPCYHLANSIHPFVHYPHNPTPRLVGHMVGFSMSGSTIFINENAMSFYTIQDHAKVNLQFFP